MKQMSLKQAMSAHPATVRGKDGLYAAYLRMQREGYRHLPVIDDNGGLAGIISDRDFQRAMLPKSTPATPGPAGESDFPRDAKVQSIR